MFSTITNFFQSITGLVTSSEVKTPDDTEIEVSVNTEIETVPDTTLVIVFDESTSMRNQSKEAVIDGLMTMIEGQPNIKRFVIWMFSTTTRKVHDGPIVTREQLWSYFNPDGMTAIYDSIWTALDDLETDTNPNKVVLFLTDGCENSSKQYTIEDTKRKDCSFIK